MPTIAPRSKNGYLERAITSVISQTYPVTGIAIANDAEHEGAAATRNRALDMVKTKWVAFLDDDDELKPRHIELCLKHAVVTRADVVYPWFDLPVGQDPLGMFGRPFDLAELDQRNWIPVTVLAKADAIRDVGGFEMHPKASASNPCEDWGLWLKLRDAGATFAHLAERTWIWHWHGRNTSGMPQRW